MFAEGNVPLVDMTAKSNGFPKRLLLPKGTKGGFPFQIFVIVYSYSPMTKSFELYKELDMDNKLLGYPFDRPVTEKSFFSSLLNQSNIFFKDVNVYHDGEELSWKMNVVTKY